MTLDEASKVYYITAKIRATKEQLKNLEEERTFLQAIQYTGMPKSSLELSNKLEKYMDKHAALEKKLTILLTELDQERDHILKYISTIDDPEMQDIILMRCVNNMTWREIGEEMNMDRRTASRKFYNFWDDQ